MNSSHLIIKDVKKLLAGVTTAIFLFLIASSPSAADSEDYSFLQSSFQDQTHNCSKGDKLEL